MSLTKSLINIKYYINIIIQHHYGRVSLRILAYQNKIKINTCKNNGTNEWNVPIDSHDWFRCIHECIPNIAEIATRSTISGTVHPLVFS